jgi:hypothetical protein
MVDQMVQVDFINDIEALQLAQSERIFTKAANVFIKKWSSREPNFIEYFKHHIMGGMKVFDISH